VSASYDKLENGEVESDKVDGNVHTLIDTTVIAVTVKKSVTWSLPATGLLILFRAFLALSPFLG